MNKSVWSDTKNATSFPELKGDAKTDVLIIGGGMAGILCARLLHDAGVPYILAEGNKIGNGITKNTTAKITVQHGLIYHKLLKGAGAQKAKMYLDINQSALSRFRELTADISCDFETKDSYVYSLTDGKIIEKELDALGEIGAEASFSGHVSMPFDIAGAVKFKDQAQFHPLKFLYGVSKDLNIFEHTFIKELAPHTAVTNNGKITAKHIIIATHFPFLNKHGGYFLKMYQHRSYAIALQNTADINGMYLEEKENGLSFRNHENLLIIGGGDHKTGKKGGNWQVLRNFADNTYLTAKEQYAWATQDCMTLDGIPYIGRYSKSADGLYVATGFNKWGMTSSMVSAMLLTDMITGRQNEAWAVFSPSRSMLKPQLLVNGLAAVGNLITPTTKRCPHMGCALKWNPVERSYDCPCHGSRFEESGKLIDNPATGDISLK